MHGSHGLCQQTGILHNHNDIAISACLTRAKSVSSSCIDQLTYFFKDVFVELLQMIRYHSLLELWHSLEIWSCADSICGIDTHTSVISIGEFKNQTNTRVWICFKSNVFSKVPFLFKHCFSRCQDVKSLQKNTLECLGVAGVTSVEKRWWNSYHGATLSWWFQVHCWFYC